MKLTENGEEFVLATEFEGESGASGKFHKLALLAFLKGRTRAALGEHRNINYMTKMLIIEMPKGSYDVQT